MHSPLSGQNQPAHHPPQDGNINRAQDRGHHQVVTVLGLVNEDLPAHCPGPFTAWPRPGGGHPVVPSSSPTTTHRATTRRVARCHDVDSEPRSAADIAVIASELSGRTTTLEVLDEDQWVATQVAAGQPEGMARFALFAHQPRTVGHLLADPHTSETER